MKSKKSTAIILAAGTGKRMNSSVAKQYLLLGGKPVLYYSIKAFEESLIDEIIVVVGKNDIEYCKTNIIDKYSFKKVVGIIEGGQERYHSVYNGLMSISYTDNVLIHDGARPLITVDIINNAVKTLDYCGACVVGVPNKDTVKLVNEEGIIMETPDRDRIWAVQTPQAFSYNLIMQAYNIVMDEKSYSGENSSRRSINITDDAMVVEHALNYPVKMIMGSYRNIKITTPEDIIIGEAFLNIDISDTEK